MPVSVASWSVEAADDSSTYPFSLTLAMMILIAVAAIAIGLTIIYGRTRFTKGEEKQSIVRSWIAVSLVVGLSIFCAASFGLVDPNLRSTLIGGFTASAGGAIAYYFSSKSADEARQDLLATFAGVDTVPSLIGKTLDEARVVLGGTYFRLQVENPDPPHSADVKIAKQTPLAGVTALRGSNVKVHLADPPKISKIDPTSYPVGGGASIKISGSNLQTTSSVMFGVTSAKDVAVVSDTEVLATVPTAASPGKVDLVVVTYGGSDNVTFIYAEEPKPPPAEGTNTGGDQNQSG